MTFGNQVPDKTLLKQVVQRLARSGSGSENQVTAAVRNGEVTFTGTLRYEHARRFILKSIGGISGIRRVIDQMRVVPKKTSYS